MSHPHSSQGSSPSKPKPPPSQPDLSLQAQAWLMRRQEVLEGYRESEGMVFHEDSDRTNPSLLPSPLRHEVYRLIKLQQISDASKTRG